MRWAVLSDRFFDHIVRRRKVARYAALGAAGALTVASVIHYTVRPGDTLSGIAQAECGHAAQWTNIYQQNRQVVGSNPNLIFVGEKLAFSCTATVPAAATLSDAAHTDAAPAASTVVTGPVVAGSLQANLVTVGRFLMAHGYSRSAAAGIAGDVAGESAGNPESVGMGGGGLIGWTPTGSARPIQPLITGNPSRDLSAQLVDLLSYNMIWSRYLPMLNGASGPVAAGEIYSQYFERPAVRYSDCRPSVAQEVYGQL